MARRGCIEMVTNRETMYIKRSFAGCRRRMLGSKLAQHCPSSTRSPVFEDKALVRWRGIRKPLMIFVDYLVGHVFVKARFMGNRGDKIADALIDTGATYTVIPRRLAEEIGAPGTGIYAEVKTANGVAKLEFTHVVLEIEGIRALEAVLVSDSLEIPLIGVRTLEGLGFRVDPTTGKLEKTGIYLLIMQLAL